ncbi:MAG: aminotransferase [Planctomycetota bacterium]
MNPPALQADELRRLQAQDAAHHLHPFTPHRAMHEVGTHVITGGQGVYLHDAEGRKLLDGIAGLWCVNVGYGRQEIVDAVERQMRELPYYCSFFNSTTKPAIELAAKLGELAPDGLGQAFFTSSGSESNETALKLVRGYFHAKGQPKRTKVIARQFAYHGVGLGSTSLTGLDTCLKPFGLPLEGFMHAPAPYQYIERDDARRAMSPEDYGLWCVEQTRQMIEAEGPATVAAVFAEPIQGAGGVIVPPRGYLTALREMCRAYGVLFVADEVITAFGRLGAWFASEICGESGLQPDLICTAKGLSSGYLPIGAVLVQDAIAETMHDAGYLAHGFTYSGHPATCAAALANLKILEDEKIVPYVADTIGPYFQAKLRGFADHPAVGEVRGVNLIGAIELIDHERQAGPAGTPIGPWFAGRVRERGVIVRGIRDLIALSPPLVISEAEVDEMFDAVGAVLNEIG